VIKEKIPLEELRLKHVLTTVITSEKYKYLALAHSRFIVHRRAHNATWHRAITVGV
jgi:hypothetical protein